MGPIVRIGVPHKEGAEALAFEDLPAAMWILDAVTLAILSATGAAARLHGTTPEEFVKASVRDLFTREEVAVFLNSLSWDGPSAPAAREQRRWDATTFRALLSVHPIRLSGRTAHLVLVHQADLLVGADLDSVEEERKRIGADLHDGLGQILAAACLLSRAVCRDLCAESSQTMGLSEELAGLLEQASGQLRALAGVLIPPEIEEGGLSLALRGLAARASRLFGLRCYALESGTPRRLPRQVESQMFRIAQEAITNAAKHSRARRVRIRLLWMPARAVLAVADDGVGAPEGRPRAGGLGTFVMAYRAERMGASLRVRRLNGLGTVVRCSRPIQPEDV